MMLAHRHGLRSRRYAADQRSRTLLRLERQCGFDFAVLRKRLRPRHVDGAAVLVDAVASLLRLAQPRRNAMLVAQKEVGRIDNDAIAFALLHFEAPDHRAGKRGLDRAALVRIVAQRAEARVLFDEQHLRTCALEADEARLPELRAIESDRIRA